MAAALVHCRAVAFITVYGFADQDPGQRCFVMHSVCWVGQLSYLGAVSHYAVQGNFLIICDLNTVLLTEGRMWNAEFVLLQKSNMLCVIPIFLNLPKFQFIFFFFTSERSVLLLVLLLLLHGVETCLYRIRSCLFDFTGGRRNIQQL